VFDLLKDDLIGIRMDTGAQHVSIPALLGHLAAGQVEGYTGLRAHQADPWHMFLVQLAASVLAHSPEHQAPRDPSFWREGLLKLSEGRASAWHLIEPDVTQPAFLQHPWSALESEAKDFGLQAQRGDWLIDAKARTPDELDVLVTSKNHDVKAQRLDANDPQAWLYALILYQTTGGFLGAGNYGVIRMNGGFGSRSTVAWVTERHVARRFISEVAALEHQRSQVIKTFCYRDRGVSLTWLKPWDRMSHQYTLTDLDPWFIEACRRVRLWTDKQGRTVALGGTSKARQIGPKSIENGDVGDPWLPINIEGKKNARSALTVSSNGFTPQLVTNLLFEQGFELTTLQKPSARSAPGWFVASVLVRGQGTTDGFHRLEVPIPAKVRMTLAKPIDDDARQTLAKAARGFLGDAKDISAALRMAVMVQIEGGSQTPDFDRDAVKRWVEPTTARFAAAWHHAYFRTLWRVADESLEIVQENWRAELLRGAEKLLRETIARLPGLAGRRWRADAQARRTFFGALKKKHLLPGTHRDEQESMA
jgi:CRISPR system Cascade subunit CasA